MSGAHTRVGCAKWFQDMNMVAAVSNIAGTATGGVKVPEGFRHEYAHLALTKPSAITVKVYGLTNIDNSSAGKWLHIDTVAFSESVDEATLVRGVTGYVRLATSVNVMAAAVNVNSYFGFSE